MADGQQTFAVDEKPPAAKVNKVARRVIVDVATINDLPASPAEGQHFYIIDTGYLCHWNGSDYTFHAAGLIDSIGGGTNTGPPITGSSVPVNGSTFSSIPMYGGHKYRYQGTISVLADANTTDFMTDIQVDGTNLSGETRYVSCDVATRHYELSWMTIYTPPDDDTYTIRMVIERFAGGGNGTVIAHDITLEHMGHVR